MKILGRILIHVVVLFVLLSCLIYFRVVIYYPSKQIPFQGAFWYNPYARVGSIKAEKVNLHAHSHQWLGLTNGDGSSMDIQRRYADLGYGLAQTSEYGLLNFDNKISCYEHGFGVAKVHQLVLNAQKVSWFEYPLFQLTGHKQDILNRLRQDNPGATLVLAHPKLRNGYSPSEMSQLSGYDLMEVVSRYRVSTEIWDSALTMGNPIFLLGSDDCHSITREGEIGRVWTYVFKGKEDDLVTSMKKGAAVAISIPFETDKKILEYHRTHKCPLLEVNLKSDSLYVKLSDELTHVRLICDGNPGSWLKVDNGEFYSNLNMVNHYCRLEFKNKIGVHLYLNPILRYNKMQMPTPIVASWEINYLSTLLHRIPPLLIFSITLFAWLRINKFNKIKINPVRLLKRKRMID